jgi:hypothetical protein
MKKKQKSILGPVAFIVILAALYGSGKAAAGSGRVTAPHIVHTSASANEKLANRMAAAYFGWTGQQVTCLDELWQRESGFSVTADTRRSGLDSPDAQVYAYGIPQARPADKMASAGADWRTNAVTQVTWGLRYVRDTYGNPCGAWDHEMAWNWY